MSTEIKHLDASNRPINKGDFVVLSNNSYSQKFNYGLVTELVVRDGGHTPAVKLTTCNLPWGRHYEDEYTPTVGSSSTKLLFKILVVGEAALHPIAVKALRGIKDPIKEIGDIEAELDTL